MQCALLNLYFINVFQMTAWGLLRRTYYLNDDNLKPEVKIGTPSGHAVLNQMEWVILVTFKSYIPKNEVHELGDLQHTLSVFCGWYIRITSEKTQMHLSKKIGHSC